MNEFSDLFKIIIDHPQVYTTLHGEFSLFFFKPLTRINGVDKFFLPFVPATFEFIRDMDLESQEVFSRKDFSPTLAVSLFPNLCQPDLVN